MYSSPRPHLEDISPILELRLIFAGIVVLGPKGLEFGLRRYIAVVAIEDIHLLPSADLHQEIAFPVDMVGGIAIRRGEKDDRLLALLVLVDLAAGEALHLVQALLEQ